jgi:hypothetical protein
MSPLNRAWGAPNTVTCISSLLFLRQCDEVHEKDEHTIMRMQCERARRDCIERCDVLDRHEIVVHISQNAGNDNLLLDLQIESCHLGIRSCRLLLQVAMAALSISPLLTAAFTRRTPSPVLIEHSSNSVNSWILPYKGARLSLLNLALPLRIPE